MYTTVKQSANEHQHKNKVQMNIKIKKSANEHQQKNKVQMNINMKQSEMIINIELS